MIFEVRTLIEPYSLRNYGAKLDIDSLAQYAHTFRYHIPDIPDLNSYDVDNAFHSFLISPLTNTYLLEMYQRIQTQNTRLRVLTGRSVTGRQYNAANEHLQIIEACMMQDWEAAAQATIKHLKASRESALSIILQGSLDNKAMDILSLQ